MVSLLDYQWKTNIDPSRYGFRRDNDGDWHRRSAVWNWNGYDTLFCDLTIYEDGYIDIDVMTELNTSYGLFYDRNALKEPIVIKINKRISNLLTSIKAYAYVEPNKGEEYSERDKAITNKRRRHYYSKKTLAGKKTS